MRRRSGGSRKRTRCGRRPYPICARSSTRCALLPSGSVVQSRVRPYPARSARHRSRRIRSRYRCRWLSVRTPLPRIRKPWGDLRGWVSITGRALDVRRHSWRTGTSSKRCTTCSGCTQSSRCGGNGTAALRRQMPNRGLFVPVILGRAGLRQVTWVPNEWVEKCINCSAEFSIFKWKNHCRLCGRSGALLDQWIRARHSSADRPAALPTCGYACAIGPRPADSDTAG